MMTVGNMRQGLLGAYMGSSYLVNVQVAGVETCLVLQYAWFYNVRGVTKDEVLCQAWVVTGVVQRRRTCLKDLMCSGLVCCWGRDGCV